MRHHACVVLLLLQLIARTAKATAGFEVVADDPNDNHNISLDLLHVLLRENLGKYETWLRPVKEQHETIVVETEFALETIVKFDTTGQGMEVMGFFNVKWKDEIMVWNPEEYNGNNVITIPLTEIWYPKLVITKSYNGQTQIGHQDLDTVKVSSEGEMQWVPGGVLSFLCDVHVEYYPFDRQTCRLVFHVAGETSSSVLLTAVQVIDTAFYTPNSEWKLLSTKTIVETKYTTNYITLQFDIARRAEFTVFTMILPLSSLSAINVFTFLVPIESGEKAFLAITVFLAYGIFVTITRDSLPHNSLQVSYYVIYLCTLLILSVCTVIYVVVEYKIHITTGQEQWRSMELKGKQNPLETDVEDFNGDEDVMAEKIKEDDESMIWSNVLRRVDFICFVICSLFVFVFSVSLWATVVNSM